jgi:ATP-binding cassette subfamily F protein 2
MAGELLPTLGDIRPHGHLKLGRFTQHFVDVLDLNLTPLEFFEKMYPGEPRDELRKYLGRFGVSGKMQMQKMDELSDGQCSRVVFAKLGKDAPHILLLDEPTNHLDMESIDALAKAVNEFSGGMVLVSHDMRLISQVAKEIWICDNKTITKYKGDIENFKMDMRAQMGIEGDMKGQLRGDASVIKKLGGAETEIKKKDNASVSKPAPTVVHEAKEFKSRADAWDDMTPVEESLPKASYVPSHLRNNDGADGNSAVSSGTRYIPPHLRNRD